MLVMILASALLSSADAESSAGTSPRESEQIFKEAERNLQDASWPNQVRAYIESSKDQKEFNKRVDFVALKIRFASSCTEWIGYQQLSISRVLHVEDYPEPIRGLVKWAVDEGQRDPLSLAKCQRILGDLRDGPVHP